MKIFKYIIILTIFAGVAMVPFYIDAAKEYNFGEKTFEKILKPITITGGVNIEEPKNLLAIITSILNFVYVVLFSASILFILLAAYTYLTAKDDAEKIKSATKQITWAAVAITVGLLSVSANYIVESFIK